MMPLCREEGIGRDSVESAGARFSGRQPPEGRFGETVRAKTDDYAHGMYYQHSDFAVVERVGDIAQARGVSNAQVALAWMLQQPGLRLRSWARARCAIWRTRWPR